MYLAVLTVDSAAYQYSRGGSMLCWDVMIRKTNSITFNPYQRGFFSFKCRKGLWKILVICSVKLSSSEIGLRGYFRVQV